MNLILLFAEDFISPGLARVTGRRFEHIRGVHRAAPGESLCVGLAGGDIGRGLVVSMDAEAVELEVVTELQPPEPLPVALVLALPRPKALRRVLGAAASMGVKSIILINAFRVEKAFWKSPALEAGAVREALILGLEQAKDTVLPGVRLRPLFKPFVEDELPELIRGTLPIVAHPSAERPCPREVHDRVTLVIGPEGGFIPYEIEKLESAGVQPVNIGARILRVETAVPALLSRLF